LPEESAVARDVDAFTAGDQRVALALAVLSAASSLTDELATDLLSLVSYDDTWVEALIRALHSCDFVIERNSEWNLAPRARDPFLRALVADAGLSLVVNSRLVRLCEPWAVGALGELPRYLREGAGAAYHGVFADGEGSLAKYSEAADGPLSGQQWLASELAMEQVELGVVPADAIEVLFLRGMVLYRERRIPEAEPLLRDVAGSAEVRREVAVAAHLVGRLDGRRFRTRQRGEALLRKSLKIDEALGDRAGATEVEHTLGQLVGRDASRSAEAEALLSRSLKSEEAAGSAEAVGEVLNTLGQLLARNPKRRAEAERVLRQSLAINEEAGRTLRTAPALHVLGQLLGRDDARREEAEGLLRRSLALGEEQGADFSVAQVLSTLGQFLGRDPERANEAEQLLQRSLAIGERLGNRNHQALTLYAAARVAGVPQGRAIEFLRRSLELNRAIGNAEGEANVLRALKGMEADLPPGPS
jgi:tetratricopeptide (TPR) repeat protein